MRHPALVVLNALLQSDKREIEGFFPGYKISIKKVEGKPVLCVKSEMVSGIKKEECFLRVNLQLTEFIRLCEELTQEQLMLIAGSTVLTSLGHERAKERGKDQTL